MSIIFCRAERAQILPDTPNFNFQFSGSTLLTCKQNNNNKSTPWSNSVFIYACISIHDNGILMWTYMSRTKNINIVSHHVVCMADNRQWKPLVKAITSHWLTRKEHHTLSIHIEIPDIEKLMILASFILWDTLAHDDFIALRQFSLMKLMIFLINYSLCKNGVILGLLAILYIIVLYCSMCLV